MQAFDMGDVRDAVRTRKKVLDAARDEFAERGFYGARTASIAERAGVTKQLLYHYFPSKDALLRATLAEKFRQRALSAKSRDEAGSVFSRRFRAVAKDVVWVRFLVWEAAEGTDKDSLMAFAERRKVSADQTAEIAALQARDDLPKDLPASFLQLAANALATYPLAFPRLTKLATGRSPRQKAFQAEWSAFLDEISARLSRRN